MMVGLLLTLSSVVASATISHGLPIEYAPKETVNGSFYFTTMIIIAFHFHGNSFREYALERDGGSSADTWSTTSTSMVQINHTV